MADDLLNSFTTGPDEQGRFGDFGGRFVSETLMPLILDLEQQYEFAKTDDSFWEEMNDLWTNYVGRPSPLYYAERLTEHLGGAKIYLKRDELNHTARIKLTMSWARLSWPAAWEKAGLSPKPVRVSMGWPPLRSVPNLV